MSLRWMVPGPAIADEAFYAGPEGRVGFYYMPQDLVYVAGVIASPQPIRPSADELYTLFDNLLATFTAPAMMELRNRLTRDAALICRPFEWVLVPNPWRDGVLLIGDAAHATTAHMGMGGGMAFEDSVVLGQCIAEAGSLEKAVEQFMERRFNRIRTVVEISIAISRGEQTGAPLSERMRLSKAAFAVLAEANDPLQSFQRCQENFCDKPSNAGCPRSLIPHRTNLQPMLGQASRRLSGARTVRSPQVRSYLSQQQPRAFRLGPLC